MNKKTIIIIVLLVLLFPIKFQYMDGGTKEYKALTYQIIKWHAINENYESGYKTGTEVHFFPNNFRSIDYYMNTEPYRLKVIYDDKSYYAYTGSFNWCNEYKNCQSVEKLMVSDFNSYEGITITNTTQIKLRLYYDIKKITVYKNSFDNIYRVLSPSDGLVIPSEAGMYMLKIEATSGNNNVEYYFKINKI